MSLAEEVSDGFKALLRKRHTKKHTLKSIAMHLFSLCIVFPNMSPRDGILRKRFFEVVIFVRLAHAYFQVFKHTFCKNTRAIYVMNFWWSAM